MSSMIPGRQKFFDSELEEKLNDFMMIEEILSEIILRVECGISMKILPPRSITNTRDKKRKVEDCENENLQHQEI